MALNQFNELLATTLRAFASAVGSGLQTATFAVNCGGANTGILAVRTVKGNATQMWIRPQFSENGTTWYDTTSQTRTGASVLVTPIQHKITVSGYSLIELKGMYGDKIRVRTQGKTTVTGCKIGVILWLDRK